MVQCFTAGACSDLFILLHCILLTAVVQLRLKHHKPGEYHPHIASASFNGGGFASLTAALKLESTREHYRSQECQDCLSLPLRPGKIAAKTFHFLTGFWIIRCTIFWHS